MLIQDENKVHDIMLDKNIVNMVRDYVEIREVKLTKVERLGKADLPKTTPRKIVID